MDDCDLSSIHADRFQRQAIARARSRYPTGESRFECVECGNEIPEARRKAVSGCTRCVPCETKAEKT